MRMKKLAAIFICALFSFVALMSFTVTAATTEQEDKDVRISHLMVQLANAQTELEAMTEAYNVLQASNQKLRKDNADLNYKITNYENISENNVLVDKLRTQQEEALQNKIWELEGKIEELNGEITHWKTMFEMQQTVSEKYQNEIYDPKNLYDVNMDGLVNLKDVYVIAAYVAEMEPEV